MKLFNFIERYIEPNSLIRLVVKDGSNYKIIKDTWNEVSMNWEVLKKEGIYKDFFYNDVIGIASISTQGHYSEAINIVLSSDVPISNNKLRGFIFQDTTTTIKKQ